MGLGLVLDVALYTKETRGGPWDWRSTAVNSWAIWANMGFSIYCFSSSFSFLLHHCKVTQKKIIKLRTNIFFIYNSMYTSFHLGVSRNFKWICYFVSFKWISTCLPKVIQNWPMCASNKFKKFEKNYI
jgi:hypothetical protein